jgi:hypothetical protein
LEGARVAGAEEDWIEGAAGPCDEKSFDACGDQFGPKKQ